jgi:phosphotransacetylase
MAKLDFILNKCQALGKIEAAVIDPRSDVALAGAIKATELGIIHPVLIGPAGEIEQIAKENNLNIAGLRIIDVPDSAAAAATAAQMAGNGEVHFLIKGSLSTETMMKAVFKSEYNLRTTQNISCCALVDLPHYDRLVFIADPAININPDLEQKVGIVKNTVAMANALGWEKPKVALVAAVEKVNPKMQLTLDAAAISKMADRGQIANCIVDGPLDLDIAISADSARIKKCHTTIMGDADILIFPDIHAANAVYKTMMFMSGGTCAVLILGARIPIVVTSRSDDEQTRIQSIAAAALVAHNNRTDRI